MLLMVEKNYQRWNVLAICHYVKANNKYMKDYDTNKEIIVS